MSVHDVAAVDRLNSLRRPKKSGEKKLSVRNETSISSDNRIPYHASLPTSPIKDGKSDGGTLRQAMARHQVRKKETNTKYFLNKKINPDNILGQSIPTRISTP